MRLLPSKWMVLLLIILLLFIFHIPILNAAADYLFIQDPIESADVIVVLAGDNNGERVSEGVNLYKAGWARKLLLSGGPVAYNFTYADLMENQAVKMGVPFNRIITQKESKSTIDDARFTFKILKGMGIHKIILVTSPYHTLRAGKVFRKIFNPADIKVVVRAVKNSAYNPHEWWKRHEDTSIVVWEYFSLVFYFFSGYL